MDPSAPEGSIASIGMGLYYFGARYYDPEIIMWTSPDPMDEFWNSYSYTGSNPINLIDTKGLKTYSIGWSGSAGAGVGGSFGKGIIVTTKKGAISQISTYTTSGKGIVAGAGASGFVDVGYSSNDDSRDLSGKGTAVGGSGGKGIMFGLEGTSQHDADAKSSYTGSIGLGDGTLAEAHTFETETEVNVIFGEGSEEPGTTVVTGSEDGAAPSDNTRTIIIFSSDTKTSENDSENNETGGTGGRVQFTTSDGTPITNLFWGGGDD